ncbi:hypothetical protein BC628DRAFT_1418666 [Trametes gibbosa]|nr:hypothetical protein BC628DRAFT_1418666 [Trametes gibbosa]
MNSTTVYPTATLSASSTPTFSLETVLVIIVAMLFILFCSGLAALVSYCRRRVTRARTQAPSLRVVDLERQAHNVGLDDGKKGSPILAFPPLAVLARSWSASASGSEGLGKLSLELPPPVLAVAPSSRLRDSVLCKVLSQLTWPVSDKAQIKNSKASSRRIIDIEAAAADKVNEFGNVNSLASDSSLSYPEWVRPHLAEFREHSKHEWTFYAPRAPVVVPKIVIESCEEDNEPACDTPGSIYSTDSTPSETDTPPPMTPTLASPVSFYFPDSPSFSVKDRLQVPPPSFHAPREEEKPVVRNVSNFSGKTFSLAAASSPFSKIGKLRERRMLARAQAGHVATDCSQNNGSVGPSVVKGCGTGPRICQGSTGSTVLVREAAGAGMSGVGLGLHFRPQQDFRISLDNALATSGPGDDNGAHRLPATFSATGYPDLDTVRETSSDVVLPPAIARRDNANIVLASLANLSALAGVDVERRKHVARRVDTLDPSCPFASLGSEDGHDKLSDILGLDNYHYDHPDESLDNAYADDSAVTELCASEIAARCAVVVHAV